YLSTIKYLIVDEYQDIDDLQEKLIYSFTRCGTNVCIVGDDDQTIYQFRGSNANNMIHFSDKYSNVSQIRLEKNFRCAKEIVDIATNVICFNQNRIQKRMVSGVTDLSKVTAKRFIKPCDEYRAISEQIATLHTKGIPYSEIAILVRKGKYINQICLSLEKYNIPFVSDSAEHFFEGPYFKRFVDTMRNLVDINKAKLYECWQDFVDEHYFNKGFRYLRQAVRQGGNGKILPLRCLFEEFLDKISFFEIDGAEIKVRREAFEGFVTILNDCDEIYKDWEFSARITELLKFLDTQAVKKYKYHNFKEEVLSDSVQVMTVHKSKGLEFNTVFIPDLEEGVFPSSKVGGIKYWHVLRGIFEENKDKFDSNIEDERKLFYVAVTRAKQNLFLYYELSTKNLSTFVKEAAHSRYLDIEKADLNYKVKRKNETKDDFFTATNIGDKQMKKTETYEQRKAYQEQIRMIRHRVMDYYGSAIHFYPAARADLDRVSKLDEDALIAEARKLGIV
ncbi:MAG: ATP-dependent helicase, partial [Lachnospiraceae bacterium]|nr:ATP-dependent helicase [Lachnospiraceae bacterium]